MSKSKKIWIATVGEPIPGDLENARLLRSCQFATWLSERGHQVTFITNSVDHYARRQRCRETTEINYSSNLKIILLWTRLYQRSASLKRLRSHNDIRSSFCQWQNKLKNKPDVIVAGYPTYEICQELSSFARDNSIPIFFDCRDAWPDIFYERMPRVLSLGLSCYRALQDKRVRHLFNEATGLLSHSREFLEWSLRKAGRNKNASDTVFHFTYPGLSLERSAKEIKHSRTLNVIFAGTLTRRNDLEFYLPVFSNGNNLRSDIKLIIAGAGEDEDRLKQICLKKNYNVEFLGWQDSKKLEQLLTHADFGLLPYLRDDFRMSLPNKFSEYIAHNLPVICVSDSASGELVKDFDCGIPLVSNHRDLHLELSKKLSKICPELIMKMSKNAKNLFEEKFERNRVFTNIERHILTYTHNNDW